MVKFASITYSDFLRAIGMQFQLSNIILSYALLKKVTKLRIYCDFFTQVDVFS